jgi:hypothetical protein
VAVIVINSTFINNKIFNMIAKICFLLLFSFICLYRGINPKPGKLPFNQNQGIVGYVYRVSGNQMPSPDRKTGAPKGARTTLYFFTLTNINQVKRLANSAFYLSVQTKLVKKADSDTGGYFHVELPVGRYSIFTKKDTLFYANRFDSYNNISPAEVQARKITKVEIRVDYDAAY